MTNETLCTIYINIVLKSFFIKNVIFLDNFEKQNNFPNYLKNILNKLKNAKNELSVISCL